MPLGGGERGGTFKCACSALGSAMYTESSNPATQLFPLALESGSSLSKEQTSKYTNTLPGATRVSSNTFPNTPEL